MSHGRRDIRLYSRIDEVARLVNHITESQSCVILDNTRCILYDYGTWTTRMHDAVCSKFHTCTITITANEASVSGFIVIFDMNAKAARIESVLFTVFCATVMLTVTYYTGRMLLDTLPALPSFVLLGIRGMPQL